MMNRQSQQGFTLVEMIVVIVITGIIGGMVAVFLKAPIQQYMDVARRADMTDIADTALRRIGRDLRLALPNSVSVAPGACPVTTANPGGAGTCSFLELLPTSGGGRYRADVASGASAGCGSLAADVLDFSAADNCFEVLGVMPPGFAFAAGDLVAVYNLGIPGASAYLANNTAAINVPGSTTAVIKLNTATLFPFASPVARFDIINQAVFYVCDTTGKTLMRYSYPVGAVPLPAALAGGNLLAGNVGAVCNFAYDANVVAQRSGLVTMNLAITETNSSGGNETVMLYSATHVSNVP
jgi:MSHA biogenesis protein MshO